MSVNVNPILVPGIKAVRPSKGKFRNLKYQSNLSAIRKYNQTIINASQAPAVQAIRTAGDIATKYIAVRAANNAVSGKAIDTYNKVIAGGQPDSNTNDEQDSKESNKNQIIIH